MKETNSIADGTRGTPALRRRGAFRGTRRISEHARKKPEGGFCFIPATALIATWWAYKRGIVGLVDVRVWLAAYEAVARRCGVRGRRRLQFVEHEIAALVGVPETRVRPSLRRLRRAGVLHWSETAVRFSDGAARLSEEQRSDLRSTVERVRNHRRKVPVPRRLLRILCRATRPVLIATALGHALRCLYYRDGACCPDGRCKASWIADVFEVDARNVKAARRNLRAMGVLVMEPTDQRSMNRWGPRVRFDLAWWNRPMQATQSPPRSQEKSRRSPPPRIDRELASRLENQKPALAASWDRWLPGTWRITDEDLAGPGDLGKLFDRLVGLGVCRAGEASRLNLFASAARARRLADRNPAGFLAALIRGQRWHFASHADEETGRAWLVELRNQRHAPQASTRSHAVRDSSRPRFDKPIRAADVLQDVLSSAAGSPTSPLAALTHRLMSQSGSGVA